LANACKKRKDLSAGYDKNGENNKDNTAASAYYSRQTVVGDIDSILQSGECLGRVIKKFINEKIYIPELIKADFDKITDDGPPQEEDLPPEDVLAPEEDEHIPIPAVHHESETSAPEPLPPPIETQIAPTVST
jgi:hypothetical protein